MCNYSTFVISLDILWMVDFSLFPTTPTKFRVSRQMCSPISHIGCYLQHMRTAHTSVPLICTLSNVSAQTKVTLICTLSNVTAQTKVTLICTLSNITVHTKVTLICTLSNITAHTKVTLICTVSNVTAQTKVTLICTLSNVMLKYCLVSRLKKLIVVIDEGSSSFTTILISVFKQTRTSLICTRHL